MIAGTRRIYHAGDTDLFDGMREIGAAGLDLALVPIWGWGSRLGPGHLDPLRAAAGARDARSRAGPCRSTGAPTRSARPRAVRRAYLRAPLAPFVAAARELAPDVEVVPLEPGESLEL